MLSTVIRNHSAISSMAAPSHLTQCNKSTQITEDVQEIIRVKITRCKQENEGEIKAHEPIFREPILAIPHKEGKREKKSKTIKKGILNLFLECPRPIPARSEPPEKTLLSKFPAGVTSLDKFSCNRSLPIRRSCDNIYSIDHLLNINCCTKGTRGSSGFICNEQEKHISTSHEQNLFTHRKKSEQELSYRPKVAPKTVKYLPNCISSADRKKEEQSFSAIKNSFTCFSAKTMNQKQNYYTPVAPAKINITPLSLNELKANPSFPSRLLYSNKSNQTPTFHNRLKNSQRVICPSFGPNPSASIKFEKLKSTVAGCNDRTHSKSAPAPPLGSRNKIPMYPPSWTVRAKVPPEKKQLITSGGSINGVAKSCGLSPGGDDCSGSDILSGPKMGPAETLHELDTKDAKDQDETEVTTRASNTEHVVPAANTPGFIDEIDKEWTNDTSNLSAAAGQQDIHLKPEFRNLGPGDTQTLVSSKKDPESNCARSILDSNQRDGTTKEALKGMNNVIECTSGNVNKDSQNKQMNDSNRTSEYTKESSNTMADIRTKARHLKDGITDIKPKSAKEKKAVCISVEKSNIFQDGNDAWGIHSTGVQSPGNKSNDSIKVNPDSVCQEVDNPSEGHFTSVQKVYSARIRRCRTAMTVCTTPCAQVSDDAIGRIIAESAKRRLQRLSPDQKVHVQRIRSSPASEIHRRRRAALKWEVEEEKRKVQQVEARKQKARAQFKWAIFMVRKVIHFMRNIISISDGMTVRTAVEEQWHQLNSSKDTKPLDFDPAAFAKNRVYSQMPQWAKNIFMKCPDDRTLSDCRKLLVLLRGMRNWEKFTERIQLVMCKAFVYEYFHSGRVILRKGHIGQNFFLIYSGSVFVNVEDRTVTGEVFLKTQVVFTKGDSFGEISLLKDEPRSATITCRQDCELLTVDKEVFAKLCPQIFEKELEEKVEFLGGTKLFHSKCWSKEMIQELCFEAQIREHKSNKVVVLDSTTDEWLYICMEGQCRIIKCLALDQEPLEHGEMKDTEGFLTANVIQAKQEEEDMVDANLEAKNKEVANQEKHVTSLHRRHLLDSMSLDYVNRNKKTKNHVETDVKLKEVQEEQGEEESEGNDEGLSPTAKLQQMLTDGVMTLNTLMAANRGKDVIYLDIGTLQTRGVFDLHHIINKTKSGSGSSLILVSNGCKLLRIHRLLFLRCITQNTDEHVRYVAAQEQYPSDEVLLNSYREKAKWDTFKHNVTSSLFDQHTSAANRRPLMAYIESLQEAKRKQDSRLLNTLKKNKPQKENKVRVQAWEQCMEKLQCNTPRKGTDNGQDRFIKGSRLKQLREILPARNRKFTPNEKLDLKEKSNESKVEQ